MTRKHEMRLSNGEELASKRKIDFIARAIASILYEKVHTQHTEITLMRTNLNFLL